MSAPVSPNAGYNGTDAVKGAALVPQTLDRIDESAAEEIEMLAHSIEAKAAADSQEILGLAKQKADELRRFAEKFREHSRKVNENLQQHCEWVAGLLKKTRELDVPIPQFNTDADDGKPVPKFLTERTTRVDAKLLEGIAKEVEKSTKSAPK